MRLSKTIRRLCVAVVGMGLAWGQDLDVIKVRPNFYMIAGAGANVGVQIGSDGVVIVDTGTAAGADKIIATLKKLTDLPVRYVINTGAEADQVGGNGKIAKSGYTIFTNAIGNAGMANSMTNGGAASILAHDSILGKMSAPTGKQSAYPVDAWPTEAFFQQRKYLRMNGEAIEVLHQQSAHNDTDSFVFFRATDVVMAGDVIDSNHFPVIDVANGGSIQGEIDALNKLVAIAVPALPFIYKGDGTAVIPGHGRVYEQQDVLDYRDMCVVVRDVVADLIKQGKTLPQVIAARPALPFEAEFGSKTGPWTTDMFVEAIYKSLTKK